MADEENWKVLGLVGVGEAGAVVLPIGADVPVVDEAGAREVRPLAHETVVEARPPGSGREFRAGGEGAVFTPPKPMRSPIFQPSATGSIGCLNQIVGFCAKADVALPAPPHLTAR